MPAGRHFAGEEYRSGPRVKVSSDGHGVVSHAGVGMLREVAEPDRARGAGHGRVGGYLSGAVDPRAGGGVRRSGRRGRRRRGLHRRRGTDAAVIGSMSSVPPRRRPRCGGWSMRGSTPPICPVSGVPAPMHGRGRGLRVRRRTPVAVAASGCRCHHHHRSLRQQGGRGADVEEDLGPSPVAGVFGPPRDRRRRSVGRAAAPGKRGQQHRRRPRQGAGVGAGIAAGWLSARPATIRAAQQILVRSRFRRCHPHLRRRVPSGPGWGSPSATPSMPGCARRSRSSTRTTAGIRRSSPAAPSATAPGSPRPPDWST